MAVFLNALSAVSILVFLMGTGFFMGHKGWMTEREKIFLGQFITNIAVPATCIVGLVGNLKFSELKLYSALVLAGVAAVAASMVLGVVVSHCLNLPRNRKGVFATMAGLANTVFIGIPVVTQIYGQDAIPYLMMYYLSNTIGLQVFGMMLIRNSGEIESQSNGVIALLIDLLKKPPVLGILVSLLLIGFDITLPTFLWTYLEYIGGTVSPLALIYCGFVLYDIGLKRLRPMEWHWLMLVLRLIIAPALTWVIISALGVTGLPRGVFTLVSGLPVVSQVPVFAGTFGADEEYAAVGASLSILLCCVSIPLLMAIMGG